MPPNSSHCKTLIGPEDYTVVESNFNCDSRNAVVFSRFSRDDRDDSIFTGLGRIAFFRGVEANWYP